MSALTRTDAPPQKTVAQRERANYEHDRRRLHEHTDRLFAFLMAIQWLAGIIAALVVSPRTWSGPMSQIHLHVWTAVLVGGAITSLPIALALLRPGRPSTRYVIASAQMMISALLIHLSGGRIETHFHVFGSLAFLAFYRDWRVLVPATVVIAADHMIRGVFWPESVFGVATASQWRWLEHAGWVIFEDIFLVRSCIQGTREMRQIASRQAQLEATNEIVETKVREQTAAISASEALFRSLTASSPVGVFRTRPGSRELTYVNERFSSLVDTHPDKLIGRDLRELIHEDDRDGTLRDWRLAMDRSADLSRECRVALPDGSTRWSHLRASRLVSDEGGHVGTLEDITARKLAEQREASLGFILEDSLHEIYIFDADTLKFLFVNRGGRNNLGYSMDELVRLTPLDLKPNFDRETFAALLQPLRTGERDSVICETAHRRKDGSSYPVELRLHTSKMADLAVFVAMVADVSERERAEQERTRLTAAIEQVAEAILITDVDGAIQYVNPAFSQITGYSRQDVLGHNPRLLKSGVHDPSFYAEMWRTILGGEDWTGVLTNKKKDGTLFEAEATISPIREASGEITNFVAVVRDVTTQRLLEAQLGHSQKLESIGQLAAGIAHEINTPTQYVGDNTRFLQDAFRDLMVPLERIGKLFDAPETTEPSAEALAEVRKAIADADVEYLTEEIPRAVEQSLEGVERVTRIVRAMKEFSHPAEDKTPLDLNKAIDSTITVARNEWKYVADLETDFDPTLEPVPCVPGDFNQAILNMIVNAAHAIGDVVGDGASGKGKIRVSTKRLDDWAEIRIADSGCGIPEQIRKKIFDPFFTTKDVGKGTGQGLSIAHTMVVQKHGGTIDVDSQPGQGTTFTIRLPLKDPAAVTEEVLS